MPELITSLNAPFENNKFPEFSTQSTLQMMTDIEQLLENYRIV